MLPRIPRKPKACGRQRQGERTAGNEAGQLVKANRW